MTPLAARVRRTNAATNVFFAFLVAAVTAACAALYGALNALIPARSRQTGPAVTADGGVAAGAAVGAGARTACATEVTSAVMRIVSHKSEPRGEPSVFSCAGGVPTRRGSQRRSVFHESANTSATIAGYVTVAALWEPTFDSLNRCRS